VTAIVSPTALKTSMEYPSAPSGLLVPLVRGDKSAFLSGSGDTLENPSKLIDDLRQSH
jgi:hypothetical protein